MTAQVPQGVKFGAFVQMGETVKRCLALGVGEGHTLPPDAKSPHSIVSRLNARYGNGERRWSYRRGIIWRLK